jgi:hypothetical protein
MTSSGSPFRVVDRTPNHAIGTYGDLVITYAFRGTIDDPAHLTVTGDLLRAEARRLGRPVRFLAVLAEAELSKPPSPVVRELAKKTMERRVGEVHKAALVVIGQGFGSAIHRAVVGSIVTILRPAVRPMVAADVRAALGYLLEPSERIDDVVAFCEQDLARRS